MRRFTRWLLPAWALPDHPLLQYELPHLRGEGARRRDSWRLGLLLALLGGAALVYARFSATTAAQGNIGAAVWQSLYYPTLALQQITLIIAFLLGAAVVDAERSRKTWDNLRATEAGARLALRARWIGILYRLRVPILAIVVVRLVFVGITLNELTAFGGRMAHIISGNAMPPLPDWRLGLMLIALNLAVHLLLPLVMLAGAAALGLVLSVLVKERVYAVVAQLLLVLAQVAFVAGAALLLAADLSGNMSLPQLPRYALYLVYGGFGDWGLLQLHLGSLGELWRHVPYGATLTLGAALQLVVGAWMADTLVALAARLAESRG